MKRLGLGALILIVVVAAAWFLWDLQKRGGPSPSAGSYQILGSHPHDCMVTHIVCSPDGKWAVSAAIGRSQGGTVIVWDLAQGKEARRFTGRGPLAVSPDSRRLIYFGEEQDTYPIVVWDFEQTKAAGAIPNDLGRNARQARFTRDGRAVIVAGAKSATEADHGAIRQYGIPDGKVQWEINAPESEIFLAFDVTSDGRTLAAGGRLAKPQNPANDSLLVTYDLATRQVEKTLSWSEWGHPRRLFFLKEDRELLVSTSAPGASLQLYNVETGNLSRQLQNQPWGPTFATAVFPGGKRVVTGQDYQIPGFLWLDEFHSKTGELVIWSLDSGGREQSVRKLGASVSSVAVAPDNQAVLAGYFDGRVALWKLAGQ